MSGQTKDDGRDARSNHHPPQLSRGVITNAQHDKERDEENDQRKHLAQKVWDRRLPFFLKIEIPQVAIDEGDDED